jgi:hypothetical protein
MHHLVTVSICLNFITGPHGHFSEPPEIHISSIGYVPREYHDNEVYIL